MSYEILSLGEVCEFSRGLTYKKSDEVECSANAVLRANNITLETGEINFDEVKYISDEIEIPASKKVKKDTLLICTASGSKKHLGKVGYIADNIDYAFGGFMGLLTPSEAIYPKYLYWLTQSKCYSDFIMGLTDGANINNLKFSQLKEFPVPVPAFREQKRIVSILDQAFADIDKARALTEQNLKSARELFESYLQKVFSQRGEGWVNSTVGDQLTLQRGFDITKKQQNPGEIPVVSSGGLKSFHDEYKVEAPGVVIGRKGSLGTVFYLEENFWPHDTTLWVKDFKGNDPKLVYYFFRGLEVKNLDSGAANPALNRNMVHPLEVSWPEKPRQAECIAALDSLSEKVAKLERLYLRKAEALDDLKKSLLQKAFSGELTNSSAEAAA